MYKRQNFELQSVAGVLSGAVVSEGGSHWFESYERIIRAYGGISAPPVPVIPLSVVDRTSRDFYFLFVVVIPRANIVTSPPSTCEEISILFTTIISSFEILTPIFIQFRFIVLDRFTARGVVLRTSFRQSFLVPTHISVQRRNVTTVNQVSNLLRSIVKLIQNTTIEGRITIPVAINRNCLLYTSPSPRD